jgi:N-dimethylarginine dimethylaminohydrolase
MSVQSEIGTVRRMVLKHPRDAFVSDLSIARQWRGLGYLGRPDLHRAAGEFDALVELFEGFGIESLFLPRDDDVGLDSLYVRDAAIATEDGLILCSMGKDERRAEPEALERAAEEWGLPIRGAITGDGLLEGGDVVWLDERTLAVGRGYRTNEEGIRQLGRILGDSIAELIVVPLPHHRGPNDVFHLMSILSPIDRDLALVHSPLLPVPFRERLLARGTRLVDTCEGEFDSLGCNLLTLAPRRCLALAGNPMTRGRLESEGVEVHVLRGEEICLKGLGGPTCLARPLERG